MTAVSSKPARRKAAGKAQPVATQLDGASKVRLDQERQSQMRALIALGRERGYLTHADINDHLPDKLPQASFR